MYFRSVVDRVLEGAIVFRLGIFSRKLGLGGILFLGEAIWTTVVPLASTSLNMLGQT